MILRLNIHRNCSGLIHCIPLLYFLGVCSINAQYPGAEYAPVDCRWPYLHQGPSTMVDDNTPNHANKVEIFPINWLAGNHYDEQSMEVNGVCWFRLDVEIEYYLYDEGDYVELNGFQVTNGTQSPMFNIAKTGIWINNRDRTFGLTMGNSSYTPPGPPPSPHPNSWARINKIGVTDSGRVPDCCGAGVAQSNTSSYCNMLWAGNECVEFLIPFGTSFRSLEYIPEGTAAASHTEERFIGMTHEAPNSSITSVESLVFNTDSLTEDMEVIRDANYCIRQIKAKDGLLDIVVISQYRFEIRRYPSESVGTKVGELYQVIGPAVQILSVANPDMTSVNNHIVITDTRGTTSLVYDYTWDAIQKGWKRDVCNGICEDSVTTTWNAANTQMTMLVESIDPVSQTVLQRTEKIMEQKPWGMTLISRTSDPGGANEEKVHYEYQETIGSSGYGGLKKVTNADGSTVIYEYDSLNRIIREHKGYDNVAADTSSYSGWTLEKYYTPLSGSGDNGTVSPLSPRTVIQKYMGNEIGRTYYIYKENETQVIECVDIGAAWTNANNLKKTTFLIGSGTYEGRIEKIFHVDGTLTTYAYTATNGIETTTTESGEGDTGLTYVVDGTKTVSVEGVEGELLSTTVYDVATNIKLDEVIYSNFDPDNRPQLISYMDGSTETFIYGCCGLEYHKDRGGVETTYVNDEMQRVKLETRLNIQTEFDYDAVGNLKKISRIGTDQSTITLTTRAYDLQGNLISEINALGGTNTFSNVEDSYYGRIETKTNPDGGVEIRTYNKDGKLYKVEGDATFETRYYRDRAYENGVWRFYTETQKKDDSGNYNIEWVKSYQDMLGRNYLTTYNDPSYSYARQESFFNNKGQLIRQEDPDGVTTLFGYNDLGKGQ